jgi:hypothetical protein
MNAGDGFVSGTAAGRRSALQFQPVSLEAASIVAPRRIFLFPCQPLSQCNELFAMVCVTQLEKAPHQAKAEQRHRIGLKSCGLRLPHHAIRC